MLARLLNKSSQHSLLCPPMRHVQINQLAQVRVFRWGAFPCLTRKRTRKTFTMAAWITTSVHRTGSALLQTSFGKLSLTNMAGAVSPQPDQSIEPPTITFTT